TPVLRLRDLHLAVAEAGGAAAEARERLVLVLQHPDGEAAVDHVLAVIARVVPAAAGVEGVAAGRLGGTADALVARVPGRPLVGAGAGVGHLDRDAAALQVEEGERVVLEPAIDGRADGERHALVGADAQLEPLPRRRHRGEVDLLDPLARRAIRAERPRLAARAHLARGVDQLPGERRLGRRGDG